MSYEVQVIKGLFVLRWIAPEPGDAKRYAEEMKKEKDAQGRKLIGLFIMPEDSAAPGEEFRKEQANLLPEIMDCIEYAIAVFEGGGFGASIKRSALVGILLLSGKRHHVHVRSSVEQALVTKPPRELPFNGKIAVEKLQLLGMCNKPANKAS